MSLQTTCHIALVYQDQMRIEHYRRTDTGWDLDVLRAPADILDFGAVAFRLPLETVYFDLGMGTEWPSRSFLVAPSAAITARPPHPGSR